MATIVVCILSDDHLHNAQFLWERGEIPQLTLMVLEEVYMCTPTLHGSPSDSVDMPADLFSLRL